MSDEEAITVADVSPGPGGVDPADDRANDPVEVPVVELLTGRGFATGKSGSGKSNTASVIIEKLLDGNFPVMIVDTDGEYYGLKEEYEILHAGADEECDIQVVPEHAEKLASLALEQNVPIILDVSGYLDDDEARELLLETTRHLFAKEKKLKKPFLLLVEECHEYIPEGGGLGEVGKMLIKVGKRGRKHGLGIVGISQRPADVKKDFITQCDWLCWHRLTWDNDTKVVGRILGSDYADAIEDLNDGEAFLMTDWNDEIQRVQFHRKQTFDAGATPGLEDFERPELKSVSSTLVSELEAISDERKNRESELADLRQQLDKKRQRIRELEGELEEARDLSRMADAFAQAMLQKAEASYRGGEGTTPAQRQRELREYERDRDDRGRERNAETRHGESEQSRARSEEKADGETESKTGPSQNSREKEGRVRARSDPTESGEGNPTEFGDDDPTGSDDGGPTQRAAEPSADASTIVSTSTDDDESGDADTSTIADTSTVDFTTGETLSIVAENLEIGTQEAIVRELRERIDALDGLPRAMLDHYRREGVSEPIDAHIDAGGDADRNVAYSRNRQLRRAGLIRHAGQGTYAYAVPDLVRDAYDDRIDEETVTAMCAEVERMLPGGDRTGSETVENAGARAVDGSIGAPSLDDASVDTELRPDTSD